MISLTKKRIALISVHGDPAVEIGKEEAGGQNVYVRQVGEALAAQGWQVDMFTRSSDREQASIVQHSPNCGTIRLVAGPQEFIPRDELYGYLPIFGERISEVSVRVRFSISLSSHELLVVFLGGNGVEKIPTLRFSRHGSDGQWHARSRLRRGRAEIYRSAARNWFAGVSEKSNSVCKCDRPLVDPVWRQQLGQAGRVRVETYFSWDGVASQLGKLYTQLLEPSAMKLDPVSA